MAKTNLMSPKYRCALPDHGWESDARDCPWCKLSSLQEHYDCTVDVLEQTRRERDQALSRLNTARRLLDELETFEHPDDPGKSIIDSKGYQLIEEVGIILGDEGPESAAAAVARYEGGHSSTAEHVASNHETTGSTPAVRSNHEHDWITRREGDIQYCRLCPEMRDAPYTVHDRMLDTCTCNVEDTDDPSEHEGGCRFRVEYRSTDPVGEGLESMAEPVITKIQGGYAHLQHDDGSVTRVAILADENST